MGQLRWWGQNIPTLSLEVANAFEWTVPAGDGYVIVEAAATASMIVWRR